MAVHITLVDSCEAVVRHIQTTFATFLSQLRPDVVHVDIQHGRVEDFDGAGVCFVNPGNCRGRMTGTLDRILLALMPDVEDDVQAVIQAYGDVAPHTGERHLPMFSALMSRSRTGRWLLTAPCAESPGPGSCRGTRNAFHSTHLALSMIICANRAGMGIRRVVMPGMGTGQTRMNRAEVARQMCDAFRAVFIDANVVNDPSQAQHPRLLIGRHHDAPTRRDNVAAPTRHD